MSLSRLVSRIAFLAIACHLPSFAQQLPREQRGAPAVNVSRADGKWIIAGKKHKVTLNESDLALSVQAGPANWAMVPSSAKDMLGRGAENRSGTAERRKHARSILLCVVSAPLRASAVRRTFAMNAFRRRYW
ncbi:MAG: hypothetical protein ACREAB_12145 [Blastocatellia bacterium]